MVSRCLFSTIYLEGVDPTGSNRYDRTVKWLRYYLQPGVRESLGYTHIVLTDNGSDESQLMRLINDGLPITIMSCPITEGLQDWPLVMDEYTITCFSYPRVEKEGRGKQHDYPYVWRGLEHMAELLPYFERIYRIDNDCFVLSERFANYLRDVEGGWVAASQEKHAGTEAEDAISVLCSNSYNLLREWVKTPYMEHNGKWLEHSLPWTRLATEFKGDRYGVAPKVRLQSQDMDWYGQCPVSVPMTFTGEEHG